MVITRLTRNQLNLGFRGFESHPLRFIIFVLFFIDLWYTLIYVVVISYKSKEDNMISKKNIPDNIDEVNTMIFKLMDKKKKKKTIFIVLLALAIILAAAGIVWWMFNKKDDDIEDEYDYDDYDEDDTCESCCCSEEAEDEINYND